MFLPVFALLGLLDTSVAANPTVQVVLVRDNTVTLPFSGVLTSLVHSTSSEDIRHIRDDLPSRAATSDSTFDVGVTNLGGNYYAARVGVGSPRLVVSLINPSLA